MELIGGREKRVLVIADPDPAWPARFERERARIAGALGATARRIDHIGSTSVPGLAAKPIVDVQVSVSDIGDEAAFVGPLAAAGYVLRVREPEDGHFMLRTPEIDVHVHICAAGSEWERRHLLLRDWLRHDAADRALYEATKRELARREWDDMNDYADAKSDVIAAMTARAESWARGQGESRRRSST
jgi:GrpB-like predicted nucleotidyltransferase (UPF0157 family)